MQSPVLSASATAVRSVSASLWPFAACLNEIEDRIGGSCTWTANNGRQELLLAQYLGPEFGELRRQLFRPEELQSAVAFSTEELAEALTQQRADGIKPLELGANQLALTSTLRIVVKWLEAGAVTTVNNERDYPAVRLTGGVALGEASGHSDMIASIMTESGDRVFMTPAGDHPSDGFGLLERIRKLHEEFTWLTSDGVVVFPMIDLDQEVGAQWVNGLSAAGSDGASWEVADARQWNKLKMNQFGAIAESHVMMAVDYACLDEPEPMILIIDRPFYFWIARNGTQQPLFAALLAPEVWKDPGPLQL